MRIRPSYFLCLFDVFSLFLSYIFRDMRNENGKKERNAISDLQRMRMRKKIIRKIEIVSNWIRFSEVDSDVKNVSLET